MTTPHRDLALVDPWQRSLERSLHRRAIVPAVRRSVARRRRASVALTSLMAFGPTGGLLAAGGFGLGRADTAQASPANRAIDAGATPEAMAFELGSRGDAVAEIQRELGVPVDGVFGPVTHRAVLDFQARNGLDVDGVVGPVTWTALFGLEQAAAAAGAGEGGVAVILRERTDGAGSPSAERPAGVPAVGGGDSPDVPAGGDGAGDGGSTPSDPGTPRTQPVSIPAPAGDGACGSLRLGDPVNGTVTSGFGPRWGRNHDGLDIAAPTGTAIRAVECGVVSFSGVQGGYGNMVCIKHSSRFETCYAHMSRIAASNGQRVQKGQVIGYVGCTGSCTGPHLHFETRVDGAARDPRPYLGGAGVPGEPTVRAAKATKTTTHARFAKRTRTTTAPQATTAHEGDWSAATGSAPAPTPQPTATTTPPATTPPATAPAAVPAPAPAPTPTTTAPAPPPTAAPAPAPTPPPAPEATAPAPTYTPPAAPTPAPPTTPTPDPTTTAPPVEPPPAAPSTSPNPVPEPEPIGPPAAPTEEVAPAAP
jgi:hypothetical protein